MLSGDGSYFWNPEDWELPLGATPEADGGQATIMLPDQYAVLKRLPAAHHQLRDRRESPQFRQPRGQTSS